MTDPTSTQNDTADLPTSNATITVALDGRSVTFELDGPELSETTQADGSVHRYLTNASQHFITTQVEAALLSLVNAQDDGAADPTPEGDRA